MANSARTQHLMTSGLMKKYAVTSAHIVNTMLPLLSDAVCELKSERVVVDIFDRIIKIAEEMKTETESVLQRYVDIQTEVQNNVASVLSKSDKIVAEHTRTSAYSVRDLQHLKVTANEMNEETKKNYDSIVIQETGMFGRMTSDEKTLFDSVLSPSYTLCGRQENPAMDKLIADRNVFTGLFHSHNRRQNALLLYGELYQEEDEITRMHEEHDKELDRFTLLKTNKIESDRENLNTLQEANAHLRHTDEQFTRIIEYWSNIATALKFVRDESESGGVYLDEIGNPAFSERFKASIGRAQKRWKVFGRICSDYVQESGMEINKLYNFLSAPIDSMATSARTRRQEELFITIEADIENTYPK